MRSRIGRFLLAAALLLLLPMNAYARAGGGQGYNGGGGGGGGGGGHGGGGGGGSGGLGFFIDILLFCLTHPYIGVPVIIIVIAYFYFQSSSGSRGQGSPPFAPPNAAMGGQELEAAISMLRQHDPNFDPQAFCNRVGAGFLKLQSAWCAQDLKAVRPFISDGVHERFSLQFAEQKSEGYRDFMDGIRIEQIAIAAARSDQIYDQLSVIIRAAAVDFPVSLANGQQLSGSRAIEPFTEIWSFLRRRGAATVVGKPGLLEGNCPNCAAPIALNESANCSNCGALLRSAEYDWVLDEITQESEWRPGGPDVVPGLAPLRELDPDLNVQSLEDRASVIFWRKCAADRAGKIDPMRKVTSPTYVDAYAARLRPAPGTPRTYFGDCAVGAVNTLKFIPSSSTSSVDKVLIEIRWSGYRFSVTPDGKSTKISDNDPHHTLFVMMRKAGVKTDVGKGISSAHCPNCGAPESGGTNGACDFCGTTLNDGSNGWVLDDILSFSDQAAQAMLR